MTNNGPEQPQGAPEQSHEIQPYGQQPDAQPPYGQPPYAQPYGQQPVPQAPAPKTNILAIVSLVSAFFIGLVAIITGHIALSQIKRTGESGRGLALAGLIIGYVSVAMVAIIVTLALVFAATIGAFFLAVDASSPGAPISSTSSSAPIAPSEEPSTDIPTGQLGAAHFDEGYLAVGTGATIVDVYLDPMCPYCRLFEETNGDQLAGLVADDTITLRLHPITFLDAASQGTDYSSRASGALTCEAALNPEGTLDYLAGLFAIQPAENSEGLPNDQLIALSNGGTSIADCVESGEYQLWAQRNTENALNGSIEDAEITSIEGTPTVLVNGILYGGSLEDAQEFGAFVAAN